MRAHVQKHVELRGQLSELILSPSLCGIKLRSLCVPQMPSQHLVGPQQQIFKKSFVSLLTGNSVGCPKGSSQQRHRDEEGEPQARWSYGRECITRLTALIVL